MSFKRDLELVIFVFSAVFWFAANVYPVMSEPIKDKEALLNFLNKMDHSNSLNWKKSTSLCKEWMGVQCNNDESQVVVLRLAEVGLHGSIPINTLGRLLGLETLSLGSNYISGPFPSDFLKLRNLSSLYLQNNKFSGPLPLDFSVWKNLNIIDLSNNAFNGSIPHSISNTTHLTTLNLANNSLSGEIPDNLPSLQELDLSNNNLTGYLPQSLKKFPSWAFFGNNLMLKNAVSPAHEPVPSTRPLKKGTTSLGEAAILGIIIGGSATGLVIAVILMVICCSNRGRLKNKASSKLDKQEQFVNKRVSETQNNNLKFFRSHGLEFDLEDLLRASSEVLGKGMSGTTYKATLEDGNAVAVKRLKEVCVSKKEFEQQMEVLGSIDHENVCGLRAYYYSKDEKLMVFEFYQHGSVSAILHVAREKGQSPLDWETRLRIAIGAARGIAHIHSEACGKLVHGNIKASNVFLNSAGYGCIADVGVAALMNLMALAATRAAGYRAPELKDSRKASQASDTYSFGVVLLELLTGKFPLHTKCGGGGGGGGDQIIHLVRWVNAVVREEWTAEVFDVELLRYPNIEEEMLETLQIALSCVGRVPDDRPSMADVAARLEGVRQVSGGGNQPAPPPALPRGAEEVIQIQVNVDEGEEGAPSKSN
ncbi:probable inactive receptor kinase At4g23740 [Cucurbita maxima]|uniref:Probable inactive receptor kinase At4g23740 n=1 Tax=Cucurbita maxima TaxID=3661 RepID=A0A6J1JY70_CUCMA|nr:probable inactive receptor kinase At4g23740 [Cucurbita maxima]XP_022995216.1 probable inactive receptor kinase At4g23740 [Cucurbita maxima]XP_022995217.1 probable inactive receptor kinase At4g23740 [Cucurbita maxima]